MKTLSEIYTEALSGVGATLGGAIFNGIVSLMLRAYRAIFSKGDIPNDCHENSAIFSLALVKKHGGMV